jgi:hypothetical protein
MIKKIVYFLALFLLVSIGELKALYASQFAQAVMQKFETCRNEQEIDRVFDAINDYKYSTKFSYKEIVLALDRQIKNRIEAVEQQKDQKINWQSAALGALCCLGAVISTGYAAWSTKKWQSGEYLNDLSRHLGVKESALDYVGGRIVLPGFFSVMFSMGAYGFIKESIHKGFQRRYERYKYVEQKIATVLQEISKQNEMGNHA